jgi:DNA invertase Pin-like site-specific DNA recombinase
MCSSSPAYPGDAVAEAPPGARRPAARSAGPVVLKQQIDTTTPTGRLVFHILGAIDEFQRELISEGTRKGLDAARAAAASAAASPS